MLIPIWIFGFAFWQKTEPKSLRDLSDLDLVKSFQETSDKRLIVSLIDRHADSLTAITMRFVKSEAEAQELGQELFLMLAEKLPTAEVQNFRSWLLRMAWNRYIDKDRRRKRMYSYQAELKEEAFSPDQIVNQRMDESVMLKTAFASLSEKEQTCIRMHYWEYKSYKEIAQELGMNFNQVRGALDRAIIKLRKQMGTAFSDYFKD